MNELGDLFRQVVEDPPYEIGPDDVLDRVRRQRRRTVLAGTAIAVTAVALGVTVATTGQHARPVQLGQSPTPTASTPPTSTPTSTSCNATTSSASVATTEGAAGTIRWTVRVRNNGSRPCTSIGYPSVSVHGTHGWYGGRNQHGGYADISGPPRRVVVPVGGSLYVVTYWSDATTAAGGCTMFDRMAVTLPGDTRMIAFAATGCLTSGTIRVGPVSAHP